MNDRICSNKRMDHRWYRLIFLLFTQISEKKYREEPRERSDQHPSSQSYSVLPSQTFYFGQSPPKYKHPAPPAAPPTAIGKVRHNEALSQPFRQHPRHDQRKSSSNTLPKTNSVPKSKENDPKIVIVSNRSAADHEVTMNNNQSSMRNLNTSSKLPAKERDQEEVNREFQSELMRAKAKLSKVGGQKSTYLGSVSSQDTPPAPPPPVLPPGPPPPPLVKASAQPRTPASASINTREELMMAIRTKGGLGGLRKTGLSNY